ncbi:MAG TPA: GSCFA domain-containing protein [Ohtaekwangia sp.]|nr:GSCFA domain-containing protein [Ohtaekwangia sp.]
MKDFRTVLKLTPAIQTLDLDSRIITAGSCFSDMIGQRLATFKIRALVNPFGTTYNPVSIHKTLLYALAGKMPSDITFLQREDIHLNYDFHSAISATTRDQLESQLRAAIMLAHDFLKSATCMMITYGTSWVYQRQGPGEIVANCHKMPSSAFSKTLLTQKQVITSFDAFYRDLKKCNPAIRLVLTVSPVRHLKDTLTHNSVSKSLLRLCCHTITEQYPDVDYFPAYELMMDDLRDYRFYKSDMIHPSTDAEDYIWEQFLERYAGASFRDFIKKWQVVQHALRHKSFHPGSSGHQIFIQQTMQQLEELSHLVDVGKERQILLEQLVNKRQ